MPRDRATDQQLDSVLMAKKDVCVGLLDRLRADTANPAEAAMVLCTALLMLAIEGAESQGLELDMDMLNVPLMDLASSMANLAALKRGRVV